MGIRAQLLLETMPAPRSFPEATKSLWGDAEFPKGSNLFCTYVMINTLERDRPQTRSVSDLFQTHMSYSILGFGLV